MVTANNQRANAVLQEAREKFFTSPKKLKVIHANFLFNSLMNAVEKRMNIMISDKELLEDNSITVSFVGTTNMWDEDEYYFEIIEKDVTEDEGKKFLLHNPSEPIIIDGLELKGIGFVKFTEKVLDEFQRLMDECGRRIFYTTFKPDKDYRNCEFSITLKVTRENKFSTNYFG